jgi:hypothetical protein
MCTGSYHKSNASRYCIVNVNIDLLCCDFHEPGYTSITCSKIEHIPYNLICTTKFNDSSILVTIISWNYLNLSLANECFAVYLLCVTYQTSLYRITCSKIEHIPLTYIFFLIYY